MNDVKLKGLVIETEKSALKLSKELTDAKKIMESCYSADQIAIQIFMQFTVCMVDSAISSLWVPYLNALKFLNIQI